MLDDLELLDTRLRNFDRARAAIDGILAHAYGAAAVARWRSRWRVFFMACAERFGYAGGTEWGVSHDRFRHGAR